jgi:hypothetical protein
VGEVEEDEGRGIRFGYDMQRGLPGDDIAGEIELGDARREEEPEGVGREIEGAERREMPATAAECCDGGRVWGGLTVRPGARRSVGRI